jgi:D-alanine-D-alanine ligase
MSQTKKKVAVLFGGRSPEHDVSIVTALQVMEALDPDLFDPIPVYVSTKGEWFTGDALRERGVYLPGPAEMERLTPVTLKLGAGGAPALESAPSGMFRKATRIELDFAFPSFHGVQGEDGCIQGAFEMAGLPYSGMRVMSASVFMDKLATKQILNDAGIPMLPSLSLPRPAKGLMLLPEEITALVGEIAFPCILKPQHLGSSIGVARVANMAELTESLPGVFRFDTHAVLEPLVPNLVEYNVAVARISAIERPKPSAELLDFKAKYLSGGGTKGGAKGTKEVGRPSEGMLSLTRDINPAIPAEMDANIRAWAVKTFDRLGGAGSPRIDFLCNSATNEIWLNEVNPAPGSFAYFLWEAASPPVSFPALLEHMIAEGEENARRNRLPTDPTPNDARLFKRK